MNNTRIINLIKNKPKEFSVTFDPIGSPPKGLVYKIDSLHRQAQSGRDGIIKKLHKYVEKFPHYPALKNFLYVAYHKRGEEKKAREILEQTLVMHPDYLFARISMATERLHNGESDKVPALLGEQMELTALYPDRDVFHVTEVLSYRYAAGWYFLEINKREEAMHQLTKMKEIDADDKRVNDLALKIADYDIRRMQQRLKKSNEKRIEVESFPTVVYEDTEIFPDFENIEVKVFYEYTPENLPPEEIRKIKNLNRESLIRDLETVIEDSIKRLNWFKGDNREVDEFVESEQSFPIHAIYWLGALEAKDSLCLILDLLRQGGEFLEFWFADILEEFIHEPLYIIAHDQLQVLKKFVLEPNISYRARLLAVKVVEQVHHHHQHRQKEVIQWFRDVLEFHVNNLDNDGIIDTGFITWTVSSISKINAIELTSLVEQIWNLNWIDEIAIGDLQEINLRMQRSPNLADQSPLPLNIEEFYNCYYLDRRPKRIYSEEELEENRRILDSIQNDPLIDFITRIESSNEQEVFDIPSDDNIGSFYSELTPYQRGEKIGRNDPCPCGSGKKHKRCCINH